MARAIITKGCKSHRGLERSPGTAARACFQTSGVRNWRRHANNDCGCCNVCSLRAGFIAVLRVPDGCGLGPAAILAEDGDVFTPQAAGSLRPEFHSNPAVATKS